MEVKELLFELKDTDCCYPNRGTVLSIDNLTIYRGEMVFITGISGIGKSTLIESLGLMNNTLINRADGYSKYFHSENTELTELWTTKHHKLNSFRRENYSFLFQENNLMPHFTAGENMMLGQLIKGIHEQTAKNKVYDIMMLLNLDASLFNEKVYNLSGGQRQRVSFIRAVSSPFKVLFADEPTGNLDAATAGLLFQILSQQLSLNRQTGIIVSHDLNLALQYGTRVCPIEVELKNGSMLGRITGENDIVKQGEKWFSVDGKPIEDAHAYLSEFLNFSESRYGE